MKLYLAPMNTLTNNAFRKLATLYGADIVFTEMVWAKRILSKNEYEEKKLLIDDEKHTVIQIIAEESKDIMPFVKLLRKKFLEIRELNLNIGCPQSTLSKKLLGGGMLKDKQKMKEFTLKFSKACKKYGFTPSVKIRIGVDKPDLESYIEIIKGAKIEKVYIHARTLMQGYVRPADYSPLTEVEGIEVVVNGDIKDEDSLKKALSFTKCTGAMIGRKALSDPTIFLRLKNKKEVPSKKEVLLKFIEFAEKTPIATVKKNVSWLTQNMVHGGKLRQKINNSRTIDEIKEVIEDI